MARPVAVNSRVLVRLARIPGMPKEDPSPEEIMQMKLGLNDAAMMASMLESKREEYDNPDLTADQLTEMLHMYPRVRPATIAFVHTTEGAVGSVNLDVYTPGSTVLQGAVGSIPKFAQRHFRLTDVQFFTREPGKDDPEDGSHEQHVAFWEPEPEEDQPERAAPRKSRK